MISLVNGDAVSIPLSSGSVNLIVTSPPYFGLRRYNAGPGEIGSEPTVAEFVDAMRAVAAECWRALRDDGVMVVNLGDSYAASATGSTGNSSTITGGQNNQREASKRPDKLPEGIPPGSRIGIPWRVAFALMDDGWTLRQEVIWQKLSAMPESTDGWSWQQHRVKVAASPRGSRYKAEAYGDKPMNEVVGKDFRDNSDLYQDCPGCPTCAPNNGLVLRKGSWRPTSAHEQIFIFVKGMGYYGDREAVKVAQQASTIGRAAYGWNGQTDDNSEGARTGSSFKRMVEGTDTMLTIPTDGLANPRDVMTFKATPFKGKHYAAFPTTLPEFFIRAYTPEGGVCSECGEPYARIVSNSPMEVQRSARAQIVGRTQTSGTMMKPPESTTLGFRRTCAHDAPARPAIVLDPFCGTGSTLIAARAQGRDGIGIDLSLEYLMSQARERLGLNAVDAWANGTGQQRTSEHADLPMFADVVP